MLSTSESIKEKEPIELILIGQVHSVNKSKIKSISLYDNEEIQNRIIYSQLRIMQIVQAFPEAAVLDEGNKMEYTVRKEEYAVILRDIFPCHENFQSLDFDDLNAEQKENLIKNKGIDILFHLGIVPVIFPTSAVCLDVDQVAYQYLDTFKKTLVDYPRLAKIASQKNSLGPDDCENMNELEEYEAFMQKVRQRNPAIFIDREKEALDFVLKASKKSGKKQAILIFGSAHQAGIIQLLEQYRGQIVLKAYIDSSMGFNGLEDKKVLHLRTQDAKDAYRSGHYKKAIEGFKNAVSFWNETPDSTPGRFNFLLNSKLNLGAALFKLAESDENASYSKVLPQLKLAMKVTDESDPSINENIKKSRALYLEAQKRYFMITFFNDRKFTQSLSRLVIAYADETPSDAQTSLNL